MPRSEEKMQQGDADGPRPRPSARPVRPLALSVIIPTYNRRAFLPEAIASVLSQTWTAAAPGARPAGAEPGTSPAQPGPDRARPNNGSAQPDPVQPRARHAQPGTDRAGAAAGLEIIVVDDGSTDGTAAYLYAAAAAAPGVLRVVTLTHGGTPGGARNAGVAAARGTLLAFLDADDLWRCDKLERQMAMHDPKGQAVLSHTRETWLRGRRIVSQAGQEHAREGDVFADALHKCIIGPSTTMMERRVFEELGGFREDLEVAEDYELWLRLTHRYPVAYLDEELTIKRAGHGDQLSERYGAIEYFRIQALRDLVEADAFGNVAVHARAAAETLARKCRIYAQGCAKRGRFEEAAEYRALAQSYE